MTVKVTNETGRIVGVGTLRWKTVGKAIVNYLEGDDESGRYMYDCVLIAEVPVSTSRFYDVQVGAEEAGTYSASGLKRNNWKLALVFG